MVGRNGRAIGQWLLAPVDRQIVLMPLGAQIASVAIIPGPKLRILALCDPAAPTETRTVELIPSDETQAGAFQLPVGGWYSSIPKY